MACDIPFIVFDCSAASADRIEFTFRGPAKLDMGLAIFLGSGLDGTCDEAIAKIVIELDRGFFDQIKKVLTLFVHVNQTSASHKGRVIDREPHAGGANLHGSVRDLRLFGLPRR